MLSVVFYTWNYEIIKVRSTTSAVMMLNALQQGNQIKNFKIQTQTGLNYILYRDATIYRYIAYRIVLRQYRCIDTKSNRIDISRIVIYQHIVAY